jgi:NAD(P)-dependent dehydrogenase (short-subunit alcohol dehydrogenase family)
MLAVLVSVLLLNICLNEEIMKIDNAPNSVLISGGTQGLGLAIARTLVENGCREIILAGRTAETGARAEAEITSLGATCHYIQADISDTDQAKNLIETSIAHFDGLNSLVNAAATTTRGSLVETDLDLWDHHMNTNLRGPFLLMQGLARHLLAKQDVGSMVNILSTSAHVGQSFLTAYSTSKGGLLTLTKNTANALRSNRIRVNAVAPGWMDTPAEAEIQKRFHGAGDDWVEKAEATMPMGQLAKPAQLAPLIAYLLSPSSGIITGATIDYDQQIIGVVPE